FGPASTLCCEASSSLLLLHLLAIDFSISFHLKRNLSSTSARLGSLTPPPASSPLPPAESILKTRASGRVSFLSPSNPICPFNLLQAKLFRFISLCFSVSCQILFVLFFI